MNKHFKKFTEDFKSLNSDNPELIKNTLANIFTMRIIGNKTHGDLAEIGITEFINLYMDGYTCEHVGKERYRAKEHEEDIEITNKKGNVIDVSLKAYGKGPLQLSTDKESQMHKLMETKSNDITDRKEIEAIFKSEAFKAFESINVLALIYEEEFEKKYSEELGKEIKLTTGGKCSVLQFDYDKVMTETARIVRVDKGESLDEDGIVVKKGARKYPIYVFLNKDNKYICEVRYGGPDANALQRGFWTHTKNADAYFVKLTAKPIPYKINNGLVDIIGLLLNSDTKFQNDIRARLKAYIKELDKQNGKK
ncbi:MAG: hypothetical protein J6Z43_09940 [Clostridiales bacterium]|nr:hypothetical protein [Clostridiales bacterium]